MRVKLLVVKKASGPDWYDVKTTVVSGFHRPRRETRNSRKKLGVVSCAITAEPDYSQIGLMEKTYRGGLY